MSERVEIFTNGYNPRSVEFDLPTNALTRGIDHRIYRIRISVLDNSSGFLVLLSYFLRYPNQDHIDAWPTDESLLSRLDDPIDYIASRTEVGIEIDLWIAEHMEQVIEAWMTLTGPTAHEKIQDIRYFRDLASEVKTLHSKLGAYRKSISELRWKHEREIEAKANALLTSEQRGSARAA